MTGKQYADKKYSNLEECLKGIIAKVFEDGLKQHEHDYLVKTKDLKANCDLAIEGRDVKIMELETENNKLLDVINNQDVKIADLEKLNSNQAESLRITMLEEEKKDKRIEELETRCTELFLQNNEFAERFEKSIEIIKRLLSCCRNYPQENAEKIEQAEQFLEKVK